jgi:hypothetical protein
VVIRSIKETTYSLVHTSIRIDIVAWEIVWLNTKRYPDKLGKNPDYQRQIICLGKDILTAIQLEVNKNGENLPIYINLAS